MAIVISGVNNNDKITASDGSIDLLSSVGFASTVNAPDLTVSNRISGKFIDVSNDIQLGTAGIVTALTFAGNVTGNINNNTLLLQTGGTERIRITSAGRVGIASASPSDVELDVCRRNTVSNAQIRLYNDLSGSGNHTIMRFKVQGTSASNFIYFGDADSDNIAQLRYQHSSDSLQYFYNNNEKLRIDSEGRILSRHSASRTVGTKTGQLQVIESGNNAAISIIQTNNAASAPFLALGKTRSANDTDSTIVQNGDSLGQILFAGADGTDVDSTGALITAKVDGTPGSNDMPAKLVFATTADGASTATPRMEISSAGIVTCRSIPSFKCAIESDASPNSGVVSEDNGYTLHSAIGGYRDSFNTGSHFNEANGRFTAPVEGLYFFGFSVMRSSSSGSGSIDLRIKKNASLMLARTYRVGYSSNFESHNVQTITRMLAGHYITFNLGANMSVYEDDSYMFGYLIG